MGSGRVAMSLALIAFVGGCNALLSLGDYRACQDVECGDAAVEASPDARADVAVTSCAASTDCAAPTPVCSHAVCVAIDSVVHSLGNFECVVLADQTLWCWGDNTHGQLGRGVIGSQFAQPQQVATSLVADPVKAGVGGQDYACALTKTNDVWCWGDGIAGGASAQSTKVALPAQAMALAGGDTTACAQLTDGSIWCWGRNETGILPCGDAGPLDAFPLGPRKLVDATAGLAEMAVGGYTACGRKAGSDTVDCFGNDSWGGLGDGAKTAQNCLTATIAGFATNELRSITAGDFVVCATDTNGWSFCWGQNYDFNNAGIIDPSANNVPDYTTPFAMPLPHTTTQLSIGWLHMCALDQSGAVTCWGESSHGTASAYTSVAHPTTIQSLPPATMISASRQFTCALLTSGDVDCWGNNQFATLGPGFKSVDTPTPQRMVW